MVAPRLRRSAGHQAVLLAFALSAASSSACTPKLDIPGGATISCGSSGDCPSGYRCDQNLCVSTTGNQAPRIVIGATSRGVVTVPIPITLIDPELETVTVTAQYAVLQPGGAWSAWTPATLAGAAGLSTLRDANTHTVTWNATDDAAGAGALLSTRQSKPDPDLPAATTVLAAAQVKLRLVPTDVHGLAGDAVESAPFLVGDSPAEAAFATAPAQLGGIAVLDPALTDAEGDAVDLLVQFRSGPTATWRAAAVVVGDTGALSSSPIPPGIVHPIAWDTSAAPNDAEPTSPQGLGRSNHPRAELRLGTRITIAGVEVFGSWSAPVTVEVVNQTGPRVIALEARRGVLTPGRSPVAVTYLVADEEADPVDARVTYSIDGGVTFTPCPEYPLPASEGLYDLATTPVVEGGIWHTFIWDAGSGLELPASVVIQVEVANRLVDAAGDPLAGRTGKAQVLLPDTLATAAGLVGTAFEERDLPISTAPNSVIVTDLNGDGVLDLLAATRSTRFTLATYFGLPGSTPLGVSGFVAGASYDLGAAPPSVVWGGISIQYVDVDGDGKRDVAFHGEHGAGWLSGQGGGVFGALHAFTTATDLAGGLCVGDFNEDGMKDVALTFGVETVDPAWGFQVQLATAPGVFGAPVRTGFERQNATLCATGDFDADGHLDLVVNDYQWGSRIFGGDGHGGFAVIGVESQLHVPTAYVVADLNGDGIDDLAQGQFDLPLVGVWLGSRKKPFPAARYYSTSGGFVNALAATDLDGDGRLDLLTDQDVLRQTHEPGIFDTGVLLEASGGRIHAGVAPNGLGFAALPRSGPAALRLVNRKAQGVWPGQGTRADFRCDTNPFVGWLTTDDVDLDGRPDLLANATFTTDALLGNGRLQAADGTFAPATTLLGPYYGGAAVWADIDGDRIDDLVYDDMVHVAAISRGPDPDFAGATFHAERSYQDGHSDLSYLRDAVNGLVVADLDGDGTREIVATRVTVDGGGSPVSKELVVLRVGTSALEVVGMVTDGSVAGMSLPPVRRFDAGDLDGDGLLDLVVTSADLPASPPAFELGIRVYRQAPRGTFTLAGTVAMPGGEAGARDVRLADLDDDGILDLLVAGTQTVYVFRGGGAAGHGNLTFAAPSALSTDYAPMQLALGDLDADGVLDLVVATVLGPVDEFRGGASQGLATGAFTARPSLATSGSRAVAIADLNGDGFEDVVAGTGTGTSVFLSEPENMFAWQTRPLVATAGREGTLFAPGYVPPAFTDAFGQAPTPNLLGYHLKRLGLEAFARRVREGVGRGVGLVPISRAYDVAGQVRLTRRRWPDPQGEARVAVELRPGAPGTGTPWVEVPLPVAQARAGTAWATADVVVVRESTDWVRASDVGSDPAANASGASGHLPRVGGADLLIPTHGSTLILRDPDGDLATGTGPRFVVDTSRSPPVVRVVTDELGTFQAYLRFAP